MTYAWKYGSNFKGAIECQCGHKDIYHDYGRSLCPSCGYWLGLNCKECKRAWKERADKRGVCIEEGCTCPKFARAQPTLFSYHA